MVKKGKSPLFSIKYLVYDFVKLTAAIPGIILFRPKWIYESDLAKKRIRGGAVVISNHEGFFDPMYCMIAVWYRRHRFVCRKEFFETKWKWLFKRFLCIPVDRDNFGINSLREIVSALKDGYLVSMFPEGHISAGGEMAKFKSGMVLMALQGRAPIVPLYVEKRKHFWNRLRFVIGEAVDVISLYGERPTFPQIEEAAALLKEKEEKLKTIAENRGRIQE